MNKYQEMYKHIADNQYQYGTDEDWELFKELVDKDKRAFCFNKVATREMCFECKENWLDSEVEGL